MLKIKIFIKDKKTNIKMLFLCVIIVYLCFFILYKPIEIAKGAKNGLLFSANTLIPSLFPFMFLSSFAVKSGLAEHMGKHLSIITEKLFGLPGYCSATVILSMIGGYPVGARGVKALYDEEMINDAQAQKMMCFCVGAGPAFIISVVGQQMLKSTAIGIIMLIAQIISAVILGIYVNLREKHHFSEHTLPKKQCINEKTPLLIKKNDIITSIVDSCADCCGGMLNMCAFVVLFSAFLAVLECSNVLGAISSLINAAGFEKNAADAVTPLLLEVMNGCKYACEGAVSPLIIAFGICWGGICVHFQLFTALNRIKISKSRFWAYRLAHGALAATITYACILAYNPALPTSAVADNTLKFTQNDSLFGSVMLIITCIAFLVSIREKAA